MAATGRCKCLAPRSERDCPIQALLRLAAVRTIPLRITLGKARPTAWSPGIFDTTAESAASKASVEPCAGVGVLNRSLANAPVSKSISAHLMEEPPTSTPTAKDDFFNPTAAL